MLKQTIIAVGALALSAGMSFAATLTPMDSGDTQLFSVDTMYDFDQSFGSGATAGTYTFTFENDSMVSAAVTVSAASITQLAINGNPVVFFTGASSVAWTTNGVVVDAASGETDSGTVNFILAPGASDTLTVAWTDVGGGNPNIDFQVAAQLQAVPLPAGALLLGTALAGFGVARRRRKS